MAAAACGGALLTAGLAVLGAATTGFALIVAPSAALLPGLTGAAGTGFAAVVLPLAFVAFWPVPALLCAGTATTATGGLEPLATPFFEDEGGFADEGVKLTAGLIPACGFFGALVACGLLATPFPLFVVEGWEAETGFDDEVDLRAALVPAGEPVGTAAVDGGPAAPTVLFAVAGD